MHPYQVHSGSSPPPKGGGHIWGKICSRSDPDIAHMKYSIDPLKLMYKGHMILDHLNFPMLNPHRQVCKYGPHLKILGNVRPNEMWKLVSYSVEMVSYSSYLRKTLQCTQNLL